MSSWSGSFFTWRKAVWAGGSLALCLGALALVFFTGAPSTETGTVSQEYGDDITFGPEGARVALVEYADFECEACAEFSPILASLRAEYGDEVLFVFRFFPLERHRYGTVSAQVAYAAHLQGKFWEMHDLLYEKQREWADSTDPYPYFDAYAEQLGLDLETFHRDAEAQATKDFITAQFVQGTAEGVGHTPWFALNGTVFTPQFQKEEFTVRIDAAL
ncbi:MAG: DsbA family protein [Thermoleophilia bacterium]